MQCLDRGSKGQVHAQWTLVGPPKLRTAVIYDPWHRADGYTAETYHDTNQHFSKLEAAVGYEAFRGPWLGNANFQVGVGASKDFHRRANKDTNAIYDWCYPISALNRGDDVALIGDESHKAQLRADLRNAAPFTKLDARMKLGRWCAFHDKHGAFKPHRVPVLMVFIPYGIVKKWWPSVAESPLCKVILDQLNVDGLEASDAEEVADIDEVTRSTMRFPRLREEVPIHLLPRQRKCRVA